MNRKLVNGLLLLAATTAACGTFTSCKDTNENFINEIDLTQSQILAKLETILNQLTDCDKDGCKEKFNELSQKLQQIIACLGGTATQGTDGNWTITWPQGWDSNTMTVLNQIIKLTEQYDLLKADINTLNNLCEALLADYQAILARLQVLPTDVIINQAHNYIFGTLNLPLGIQSTVLGGYYYYSENQVEFPFDGKECADNDAIATATETLSGYPTITLADNTYYGYDAVENTLDLGTIYVSINPNYIDFTDGIHQQKLSLVKSNGETTPFILTPSISDEVLTWGYSRAESTPRQDGLLYAVKVSLPATEEAIEEVGIKIEPGLKSALTDLLKVRSKREAVQDLAQIAEVIYREMEGFLPAYGIKAEWESNTGVPTVSTDNTTDPATQTITQNTENMYVISKYELAATTFHPLSFETAKDLTNAHTPLPTFGPLSEAFDRVFKDITKNITIDLGLHQVDGLKAEKIKIDLSKVSLNLTVSPIEIEIPGQDVKIESTGEYVTIEPTKIKLTYDKDGNVNLKTGEGALNGLVTGITEAINELLKGKGEGSLSYEINKSIQQDIVGQVNTMINDLNKQLLSLQPNLDQQIDKILNNIHDQLAGKLGAADKIVSLYNRLANKVNGFIQNPNAYLQVMAVVKGNDGELHVLSTDANQPTVFTKNGNAAEIYLTSYTGELIAPVYKKYINFLDAAPAMEGFNEILPGRQNKVALDVNALSAGAHTIVYTALDYRGRTSTRLYYIYVK